MFPCFWNGSFFLKKARLAAKMLLQLEFRKQKHAKFSSHHPPDFIYPGTPGQSLKSSSFSILWYGPQSSQHRRLVICDHRT